MGSSGTKSKAPSKAEEIQGNIQNLNHKQIENHLVNMPKTHLSPNFIRFIF